MTLVPARFDDAYTAAEGPAHIELKAERRSCFFTVNEGGPMGLIEMFPFRRNEDVAARP